MVGYKLMRPIEFGKVDFAGLGSSFGFNQQFNFAANISTPDIQIVESSVLRPLVGKAMYDDMISVRNTLMSDYSTPTAIVPMFPTNAAYEAFWQAFGISLITFAMFSQKMGYNLVQTTNSGDVELNGEGFDVADKVNQAQRKNAAKTDLRGLIKCAEEYLCDNRADFPLLRADICGEISCCNPINTGATVEYKSKETPLEQLGFYL